MTRPARSTSPSLLASAPTQRSERCTRLLRTADRKCSQRYAPWISGKRAVGRRVASPPHQRSPQVASGRWNDGTLSDDRQGAPEGDGGAAQEMLVLRESGGQSNQLDPGVWGHPP